MTASCAEFRVTRQRMRNRWCRAKSLPNGPTGDDLVCATIIADFAVWRGRDLTSAPAEFAAASGPGTFLYGLYEK
jgi:hypothetical protein